MSTPQVVRCGCGKEFTFIRDTIEECPECGMEYVSHRSSKVRNAEEDSKDIKDNVTND